MDAISTDIHVSAASNLLIEDHVLAQLGGNNVVTHVKDIGLPASADIAALHYITDQKLLFTLKSTTQLGDVTAGAGDVLQWEDGTISLIVTAETLGLGPATGIDAMTMSGDLMRCDPSGGTITIYRRISDFGDHWAFASIDALSKFDETAVFADGFEETTRN